ncbi:MAG: LPS export ABC transporter ATP-binding protein [Rickettsiales bacterium]
MTTIKATNLKKFYDKRPVVKGVDIEIKTGEVVGLLGPNGAGKTTCFYMITGLVSADVGEIKMDDANLTEMPMYQRARKGIGYLPQEPSIFRGMTVEENIMTVLEIVEEDYDDRAKKLDELLGEFSISHLRNASAINLSGGERRRLEIARCLASNPKFVLLDEPLAGIDPIAVGDIKDLIYHLKERKIGVLITDHNVREMLDIIDRAYIISDGVVIMSGTPKEVIKDKRVRSVYLGENF